VLFGPFENLDVSRMEQIECAERNYSSQFISRNLVLEVKECLIFPFTNGNRGYFSH